MKNTLRIIGGEYRGRKLQFANLPDLRPTGDRVRETLFNWLMHDIQHAKCCDAFAGSGALGFEALSRGADLTVFCDANNSICQSIQQAAKVLGCYDRISVHVIEAQRYFSQKVTVPMDIIFCDPPFRLALEILPDLLARTLKNGWLADQGKIYVEAPGFLDDDVLATLGLSWYKQKKIGEVYFGLLHRRPR